MVILQLGSPPVVSGLRKNSIVPGGFLVESVQWGARSTPLSSRAGGTARDTGAVIHEATILAKGEEVSATKILEMAAKGAPIPVAKLSFFGNSPVDTMGFQMVMTDVIFSFVRPSGIDVEFTLNFKDSEQRTMIRL